MSDADRLKFVTLLREHQNQVFAYLFSLVRGMEDTEDLFQQASLVLWKKFDEFEPGSNFFAWACQIARFEVTNFLRRKQQESRAFSDEAMERLADMQANVAVEESARQEALDHCLEQLPEKQNQLLRDCYDGRRTVREIAASLGRTTHSVYSSLRHIRQQLHDCILRFLAREDTR